MCLGCEFGSVKLEILVPENCDLKEFIEKTQNFAFNLISISKEKPIYYSLKYGSGMDCAEFKFKIHCSCIFRQTKNTCAKFKMRQENDCKIDRLLYSKSPSEKIEVKLENST